MSRVFRRMLLLCMGMRCAAAPFAMEVEVVDEGGVPVAAAAVSSETIPRLALNPWNAPAPRLRVEATADGRGKVRLAGEHALPELVVLAVGPGFHAAAIRVARASTTVRLVLPRRAAGAASVRLDLLTRALPDDGAEHGFDLLRGAFTPPLGVGERADVWLRGRRPSASLPRPSRPDHVDEAVMRFAGPRDGVIAVPRPGQSGFAESISPACVGMILPELLAPRQAPADGYRPELVYRSPRGPSPDNLADPGRVGAPQWIFRVTRDTVEWHGVITDFGWLPDGRLRLTYRVSSEPCNPSLDFGP